MPVNIQIWLAPRLWQYLTRINWIIKSPIQTNISPIMHILIHSIICWRWRTTEKTSMSSFRRENIWHLNLYFRIVTIKLVILFKSINLCISLWHVLWNNAIETTTWVLNNLATNVHLTLQILFAVVELTVKSAFCFLMTIYIPWVLNLAQILFERFLMLFHWVFLQQLRHLWHGTLNSIVPWTNLRRFLWCHRTDIIRLSWINWHLITLNYNY